MRICSLHSLKKQRGSSGGCIDDGCDVVANIKVDGATGADI
jgi:hypothetical protein